MHTTRACGAEDSSSNSAIDFGGIVSAIKVQNGGWLEFSGLALRNPAPAHWTSINDTYIVNTAFASLPSINTEPNATVSTLLITTCGVAQRGGGEGFRLCSVMNTCKAPCHVVLQVVYTNVSAQYYSGYAGNNPTQYTQRVYYAIEQLGTTVSSQASQSGNTTITWTGPTYLALPASANVTGKYLTATLRLRLAVVLMLVEAYTCTTVC